MYGGLVSSISAGLFPVHEVMVFTNTLWQIFNGPATANYDEDLGTLILSDWHHESIYSLWFVSRQGAPAMLDSGLINGTNIYDCDASGDSTCTGVLGQKYETVFESGKTYLIRLVNVATDGHFQFSIDGHSLTVIATDFVPIVPYTTDSVSLSIAQRIDVLVEANADVGDYWIRGGWVTACSNINNPSNITGILRYDSSSTADPTSTSTVTASTSCGDEPYVRIIVALRPVLNNAVCFPRFCVLAIDLELFDRNQLCHISLWMSNPPLKVSLLRNWRRQLAPISCGLSMVAASIWTGPVRHSTRLRMGTLSFPRRTMLFPSM